MSWWTLEGRCLGVVRLWQHHAVLLLPTQQDVAMMLDSLYALACLLLGLVSHLHAQGRVLL
jgi:hypothetical protein